MDTITQLQKEIVALRNQIVAAQTKGASTEYLKAERDALLVRLNRMANQELA